MNNENNDVLANRMPEIEEVLKSCSDSQLATVSGHFFPAYTKNPPEGVNINTIPIKGKEKAIKDMLKRLDVFIIQV